ncbi:MAG: helix-turn-helix transcriptional regulator [Clostridia bacterium]|nr:helix-turn-helix transcriptional regulator [Clostridia bacterium]
MTIGERIKQLRKKNDLTQEKLADFLCVSYQAVSKWETGLSSPDLALIVPLAKLLNVTTDELLGAIPENNDMRYAELKADYDETFKNGDMLARLNVCETAVKEYPGDMKWLNNYAWTVWCRDIGELDGEAYEQEREKAIKLFDTVIENADDDKIKVDAITGIVQCLCGKGCKKEAKKYVDLFPEAKIIPSDKDKLLGMCLEGEEQIKHKQHYLEGTFMVLIDTLLWNNISENKYTCKAAEEIINAMIPDGNYCSYHYEMAHIQFRKAEIEAKEQHINEAVELLKKSIHHAKEYDLLDSISPGEYAFSAPLFNKLTIDSRKWCHTGNTTLLDDIKAMCKRKSFNTIRDYKEYSELFEK